MLDYYIYIFFNNNISSSSSSSSDDDDSFLHSCPAPTSSSSSSSSASTIISSISSTFASKNHFGWVFLLIASSFCLLLLLFKMVLRELIIPFSFHFKRNNIKELANISKKIELQQQKKRQNSARAFGPKKKLRDRSIANTTFVINNNNNNNNNSNNSSSSVDDDGDKSNGMAMRESENQIKTRGGYCVPRVIPKGRHESFITKYAQRNGDVFLIASILRFPPGTRFDPSLLALALDALLAYNPVLRYADSEDHQSFVYFPSAKNIPFDVVPHGYDRPDSSPSLVHPPPSSSSSSSSSCYPFETRFLEQNMLQGFDSQVPPLLRCTLIKGSNAIQEDPSNRADSLFVAMEHRLGDGRSFQHIVAQLLILYGIAATIRQQKRLSEIPSTPAPDGPSLRSSDPHSSPDDETGPRVTLDEILAHPVLASDIHPITQPVIFEHLVSSFIPHFIRVFLVLFFLFSFFLFHGYDRLPYEPSAQDPDKKKAQKSPSDPSSPAAAAAASSSSSSINNPIQWRTRITHVEIDAETMQKLHAAAREKNISLTFVIGSAVIMAISTVIYEVRSLGDRWMEQIQSGARGKGHTGCNFRNSHYNNSQRGTYSKWKSYIDLPMTTLVDFRFEIFQKNKEIVQDSDLKDIFGNFANGSAMAFKVPNRAIRCALFDESNPSSSSSSSSSSTATERDSNREETVQYLWKLAKDHRKAFKREYFRRTALLLMLHAKLLVLPSFGHKSWDMRVFTIPPLLLPPPPVCLSVFLY